MTSLFLLSSTCQTLHMFKKPHKTHPSISDPKGDFVGQFGNNIFTACVSFSASTSTNPTLFQELHVSPIFLCLHYINLAAWRPYAATESAWPSLYYNSFQIKFSSHISVPTFNLTLLKDAKPTHLAHVKFFFSNVEFFCLKVFWIK